MASAKATDSAVAHRTAMPGGLAGSSRGAPTRPVGALFSSQSTSQSKSSDGAADIAKLPVVPNRILKEIPRERRSASRDD